MHLWSVHCIVWKYTYTSLRVLGFTLQMQKWYCNLRFKVARKRSEIDPGFVISGTINEFINVYFTRVGVTTAWFLWWWYCHIIAFGGYGRRKPLIVIKASCLLELFHYALCALSHHSIHIILPSVSVCSRICNSVICFCRVESNWVIFSMGHIY